LLRREGGTSIKLSIDRRSVDPWCESAS